MYFLDGKGVGEPVELNIYSSPADGVTNDGQI